jgi:hypothetical protein
VAQIIIEETDSDLLIGWSELSETIETIDRKQTEKELLEIIKQTMRTAGVFKRL